MSLLQLLPFLIIVGASYWIYRVAKRTPPAVATDLAGVGGWLMFLVIGFTVLWPLFSAGQVANNFEQAERAAAYLKNSSSWAAYKTATWWCVLFMAGASIYAGIGLAKGRVRAVVRRAIAVLWINGPVAGLVLGALIPAMTMDGSLDAGTVAKWILVSSIAALVWTGYLLKSKRVKATYGVGAQ